MTNFCILPLFVRECKELYQKAKRRSGHEYLIVNSRADDNEAN